jgi:hypothetical protein
MQYRVEILFKKGPSFEINIDAADMTKAREQAIEEARIFGYDATVRKTTVQPAEQVE